jgi:hypothetical protein
VLKWADSKCFLSEVIPHLLVNVANRLCNESSECNDGPRKEGLDYPQHVYQGSDSGAFTDEDRTSCLREVVRWAAIAFQSPRMHGGRASTSFVCAGSFQLSTLAVARWERFLARAIHELCGLRRKAYELGRSVRKACVFFYCYKTKVYRLSSAS